MWEYVCVCMWCWQRHLGVVGVDIALSDIDDLVYSSTPLGSRLHLFVVDRVDETVLIHPFFKHSLEVSPFIYIYIYIYIYTNFILQGHDQSSFTWTYSVHVECGVEYGGMWSEYLSSLARRFEVFECFLVTHADIVGRRRRSLDVWNFGSVCLFVYLSVCIYVCSITQKRMIPECSNLL